MTRFPRISFGMIALNGEPFIRYNLRSLYPFAHEILVVEGAVRKAAALATEDGHSRDGTLETLQRFKLEEDPEDKVHIITHNGFWSEKDEMSQAYAACATGDYLWQVDSDEFYKAEDMQTIIDMLANDPQIAAITFETKTFWGAPDTITGGWRLERGEKYFHRLFKWGEGYRYVTHRPPTVYNAEGVDTRALKWIRGQEMARRGIYLYHYSLLFPRQVLEKMEYYGSAEWTRQEYEESILWAQEAYLQLKKPFRPHNIYQFPSWLERYDGAHPQMIIELWRDLQAGKIKIEARQMEDVERLLRSWDYRWKRFIVKRWDYAHRLYLFLNKWRWRFVKTLAQIKRRML